MRRSGSSRLALAMVVAVSLAACKSASTTFDAAVERGPANGDPNDLLSDFAQDRAIVVPLGDPVRNGIWYSYNDGTCRQTPAHGEAYYPSTPAVLPPGFSGGRALHGSWSQCSVWGAGVGADFAVPVGADSAAVGPRTPYNLAAVRRRGVLGDGGARDQHAGAREAGDAHLDADPGPGRV